jgi:hypothetical protein
MGTQHARHVFRLRAEDRRCGFIPVFSNPAPSCHGNRCSLPFPNKCICSSRTACRRNTEGDAFERPPLGVALLMVDRSYFFFAAFFAGAFLAAFFAGAFLAAFLVAIFPILPFRWFASMPAIFKLQLMNV